MSLQKILSQHIKSAFKSQFQTEIDRIEFQATRKDFEGDITVVTFPMLRMVKMNPVQLGDQLGAYLVAHSDEVVSFNVVKGFLNLVLSDTYFFQLFRRIQSVEKFGFISAAQSDAVMVEYSSPNTNKPLHLGHIRNNLLGFSIAEILKASGKKVYKTQIIPLHTTGVQQ